VQRLRADREQTAAALRSGMVLSGFTAVAMAALMPMDWVNRLTWLPETQLLPRVLVTLVIALAATTIDVVFRSAAVQKPEPWALGLSGLGVLALFVLRPIVRLVVVPVNLLLKPFGAKVSFQPPPPSLDELEKMLTAEAQKQELDKGAPQLIRSIFELSDKSCRDVMVPRTDVVALELSTPVEEILRLIAEENHSRIPVYRETADNVVGILHVRDLVPLIQSPSLIVLQDLLRPAVYVPWVKPIGDLLREMQRERIHMAVVVDEYGGFSGIVTLEDILTEIVGDIGDEFDDDEKAVERQPDGTFLVAATVGREEFTKSFDFKIPEGEFETLGGYLSHLAGSIPEVGDRFTVNGWGFVVHSKDGPRLERVKVTRPRPPSLETSPRRNSQEIEIVAAVGGGQR
jgi:putative hemolysin